MTNDTFIVGVELQSDENGFTGRKCPAEECKRYLKIQFGTGLQEPAPCYKSNNAGLLKCNI